MSQDINIELNIAPELYDVLDEFELKQLLGELAYNLYKAAILLR